MINAILFALIVMLLVYILIKFFGAWLGCITILLYLLAIIFVPILAFLLLTAAFAELVEIILNAFM